MSWYELTTIKRHKQLLKIVFLQRGTWAPCLQMDVQGFSRETVANATAASGLDLHYAKVREFFPNRASCGFSGAQK